PGRGGVNSGQLGRELPGQPDVSDHGPSPRVGGDLLHLRRLGGRHVALRARQGPRNQGEDAGGDQPAVALTSWERSRAAIPGAARAIAERLGRWGGAASRRRRACGGEPPPGWATGRYGSWRGGAGLTPTTLPPTPIDAHVRSEGTRPAGRGHARPRTGCSVAL